MFKKILITIAVIIAVLYGARAWLQTLLPERAEIDALKLTQSTDLPYINDNVPEHRGKILAVVTSVDTMGNSGESTGYEMTELARAYWVFTANGFSVDIASPKGGEAPMVLDGDDMGAYDYAFINDKEIANKLKHTHKLSDIKPLEYDAVYFVGGKGTMFDFPENKDIQRIAKTLFQHDRVVSAVCHGPAALVNVQLDNGDMLLANKKVSGFTNEEELFLIPDAKDIFPFLLQDKLTERGARFQTGITYLEKVSQDGKLITGQNPWSVWTMSEMVIKELGYEPKPRIRTPEEYSVELLLTYENQGFDAASKLLQQEPDAYHRILILMHGIVSFMQWEMGKGFDLLMFAKQIRDLTA